MSSVKRQSGRMVLIGLFFMLFCVSFWAAGCSSSSSDHASALDDRILEGFDNLRSHISGLTAALDADQRSLLAGKVSEARSAYVSGDPCGAADILAQYLDETQNLRSGNLTATAEDLHNRGWMLRSDLLTSLTEVCEGYEKIGVDPVVSVSESDNTRVSASVSFGEPRMWTVTQNGETFTQLQVPGVAFPVSPEGYPAVPVYRKFVAVPQEAEVTVSATAKGAQTIRMNLYPVQTQPTDADDDVPFVQDDGAYASGANYPQSVCSVHPVGMMRDVYIAEIICAAGQYNPATDTMTLYDSVDFVVSFSGGTGYFITERSTSPFDRTLPLVDGVVINSRALLEYVEPETDVTMLDLGQELLILTHPDFREAADRLAEWKNEKGILTKVYTVSDGDGEGPDDNTEIDAFIEDTYESNLFPPSYVLLMGGGDFIPTFETESGSEYDSPNSAKSIVYSDYPYSVIGGEYDAAEDDFSFPDLALGRIPVETLEEALVVVDKIIAYESTPPGRTSFYQNASVAGAFQCCRRFTDGYGWAQRTFIQALEFIRDAMRDEGYTVERIYTTIDCGADSPRYYYDGTSLPDDLLAENGFPWDGDTQDIIDAFTSDQGRFLIIHRDHGGTRSWEHPYFDTTNIANDLDNQDPELLPVVFSINCLTGTFQYGGDCFADQLLCKEGGGAVGVFAATSLSPSYANSNMAMGMVDAVWPDAIGNFGGDEGIYRLGDLLNHGKLYMLSQAGSVAEMVDRTEQWAKTRSRRDFLLFHCFGDPTLEIWTQPPDQLPEDAEVQEIADGIRVDYGVDGTVVTVYQQTEDGVVALGRGTIVNGQADISYIQDPDDGYPIMISVNKAGYVAGVLTPTASTITASAGTGGTISPSGSVSVDFGSDQAFSISSNTGYVITDVLVDGVSQGSLSSYTFENVKGDHTITSSFSQRTYAITASAGANGTIAPSGATQVNYGSAQTFTFTPASGYEVDTVMVDGQATAMTGNTYTFTNITSNHTIDVSFTASAAETAWSRTYGHADWYTEYHTYGLDLTDDGGYVFASDGSYNGAGGYDFWVVRVDSQGAVVWETGFGGSSEDHPQVVCQAADGGFIVAGQSYSYHTGSSYCDVWVIKLTSAGAIDWQTTYGGTGTDVAYDLKETFDGLGDSTGFLLCGYTSSFGAGGRDIWLVKLNSSGTIMKEVALGGTGDEYGRSVAPTSDGGCIVVADTQSFGAGGRDIWVVKLDSAYNVAWEKTLGGSGDEYPHGVACTDDGGYIMGARTDSFGAGDDDFWAIKLDADGSLAWQYTYGGLKTDIAQDLEKTGSGGYVMTGWTLSFDVDSYDAWVVKLGDDGLIEWQKSYNITYDDGTDTWNGNEWAYNVVQAADGGYVVAGDSDAMDERNGDAWLFKLDSGGALGCAIETDTNAVADGTAVVTVSDTSGQSSITDTGAVAGTSTSSAYAGSPEVSTQCETP